MLSYYVTYQTKATFTKFKKLHTIFSFRIMFLFFSFSYYFFSCSFFLPFDCRNIYIHIQIYIYIILPLPSSSILYHHHVWDTSIITPARVCALTKFPEMPLVDDTSSQKSESGKQTPLSKSVRQLPRLDTVLGHGIIDELLRVEGLTNALAIPLIAELVEGVDLITLEVALEVALSGVVLGKVIPRENRTVTLEEGPANRGARAVEKASV